MPKSPTHTLVWIPACAAYEYWTQGQRECSFQDGDTHWPTWLEAHPAFSFRGQRGHLNVLKENRQRGRGYWYAYRGLEKRTIKRYLGPTARVTLARLEEVAGTLEQELALTNAHLPAADDGAKKSHTGLVGPEQALLLPLALKFRPPRLRVQFVERPRLTHLLEQGQAYGLTVLSAPAGSGKTTLVSQWLASFQPAETAVAWVSLDEHDNEAVHFWRGVICACQGMLGKRAQTVLEQLNTLERSPSLLEAPVLELVLTSLLHELAAMPGRGILALEDYHVITIPQIHASLAFWLEHLPSHLHVVMLTRHDPPLPLAEWRVHGILHEMRSSTLRFTADEAALFFQRNSTYAVSNHDMARLLERTEGWIAGLQLAALALNAQDTGETVSNVFEGKHRYVSDYLIHEVLNHLPEHVQLFLQQTSLLERLQGRLCEAVTGQAEGQNMLEWLEQTNLFLIPLDEAGQWYRYHHLFRTLLRQRLARRAPTELAELHRRACRWFLQEQMIVEAVEQAYAAGDADLLADIIEQSQFDMLQRGENATLAAWINLLPQTILLARPLLLFLACMEYMATRRALVAAELLNTYAHQHHLPATGTGDVDELERALCEHVRQLLPAQPSDNLARTRLLYGFFGLYATLALITEENIALYQQTRQLSERYAPAPVQRRQESWLATLLQGNVHGAITDLMNHLTASTTRQISDPLFTYIYPTLVSLLTTTGQLQVIESTARRALQRHDTLDARLIHGPALIDLGLIAYERNQLKQAEESIQAGLPLCHYPGSEAARCYGLATLTKIKQALGEENAAWATLQELETFLARGNFEPGMLKNWRGLLAWGALDLGGVSYAQSWLQDISIAQPLITRFNPLSAKIYLIQALLLQHCQRRAEAESLLLHLNQRARQLKLSGTLIPVLALQAVLAQEKGETARAVPLLKEALTLAEASGYARTFLDLGETMRTLLIHLWHQRHAEDQGAPEYYLEWLIVSARNNETGDSHTRSTVSQALVEPLSQRELEVLHCLNAGYSNQEIARQLVIASSTVKSHIQSIYRKLQARSRTQAIARARALNLFLN